MREVEFVHVKSGYESKVPVKVQEDTSNELEKFQHRLGRPTQQ